MSQDDDKIKSGDTVAKPENDTTMNKTNTAETVNALLNKPSTSDDWANNVKSQELVSNVRENMVSKATEFLINKSVQHRPIENKVDFLRSKGLTDQEITASLQRAETRCNQISYHNPSPVHYNSSAMAGVVQTPFEAQNWYRRLFGPIAFAATFAYIAYQIYKKYVESWLFGVKKPSVGNRLEALEVSMQRVLVLLEDKNITSDASYNAHIDRQREHDQLRSELKIIKSLLLNKSQFPPAPMASSIPQWQLPKNSKLQVEQQNKVNGTDSPGKTDQKQVNNMYIPSTSKQNKSNDISTPSTSQHEPYKISVLDLPTSVIVDETISNYDIFNGKILPKNSDQSIIKRDVDQSDENKQSVNSENLIL